MPSKRIYALDVISGKIEDINISLVSDILKECSDLYYNQNPDQESYLNDDEYNALELIYKTFVDDIPVGSPVRTGKIDLPTIMGSLDQIYDGDFEKFVRDSNLSPNDIIVIGDKQDGVSGSSTYVDGKLRISYSRGDGEQGADVTRHIIRIKNAIKNISNYKGILEVRYEVIVPIEPFKKMVDDLIKSGSTKIPKNPRNYCAGQMNSEVAEDWFCENAVVIITSILDDNYNMDKSKEYEFIKSLGFDVTHYETKKVSEINDDFLKDYTLKRKSSSKTEIDGVVLDIDDKNKRKNMIWKKGSLNPPFSKKFKINDKAVEANVIKVHWNPRKTGYIKPRVEISPVELNGVTVSFCSGFNAKFIVDNKIGPGAKITITRAGDVIPDIVSVISSGKVEMPLEEYEWNETNVDIVIKDKSNRSVIVSSLTHSFGELKVPYLRMASIEKLVDSGYDTMTKIIKLNKSTLQTILGDSSGEKVYDGIKSSLNPVKISTLAGASNMFGRGIGIKLMELISKEIKFDAIIDPKTTVNMIENINGFGDKTARLVKSNQSKFLKFIDDIEGYYTFVDETKITTGTKFANLKVCFTGVRDKDLEEKISKNGGKIISAIKDKDSYLVCKDKTKNSSKMEQARKMLDDDHIITLDEALKLWGE